jgi:hypothetical protein
MMECSKTLIENTARLHGRRDLAGMLARDLVAAREALRRIADHAVIVVVEPIGALDEIREIAEAALGEGGRS